MISLFTRYNISLEEERELALQRLKDVCDNNFISVLDFVNNPMKIFAAHELVGIIDPSTCTKMTVQFNLFGGTVLKLGTARHHDKLLKVGPPRLFRNGRRPMPYKNTHGICTITLRLSYEPKKVWAFILRKCYGLQDTYAYAQMTYAQMDFSPLMSSVDVW